MYLTLKEESILSQAMNSDTIACRSIIMEKQVFIINVVQFRVTCKNLIFEKHIFNRKLLIMKKHLLVLMIVFTSVISFAQKGSWYIGGVGGYGSNTQDPTDGTKSTTNSWAFGPEEVPSCRTIFSWVLFLD
jgi:hypothetical protein